MPILGNLQTSLVRDANVALALSFFPRWRGGFWQQLAGSTLSTALVEPFSLAGASPLMQRYQGSVASRGISSWSLQVPNLLFKNYEEIRRTDIEMDQTGTILKRVQQIGIRVAQLPDYLMAKRILAADSSTSASIVFEDGNTYYSTFENGVQFFSTAHTTYAANTQSNIIQGNLPTSLTGVNIATLANDMQQDIQTLVDAIAGVVDDKGAQIFPDFDPEQHLVIVVPPILKQVARLAFSTLGATIGGSNGTNGSSGGTTSIGPTMVKRVISSPLLKGCIDVEDKDPAKTITPANATQYYAFIENDLVKPFYFQRFRPKRNGEHMPLGTDPEAAAQAAIAAAKKAGVPNIDSPEAQDVFSMAEVDHNLSALGSNAQQSVVANESFFMSGRTRMNFVYGPWFTGWKIDPSGTSN